MGTHNAILATALLGAFAAIPVLAADSAANAPSEPVAATAARAADDSCLQNNRLWSWRVVNNRTISITDRTSKQFNLTLAGGCVGLNNLIPEIEIRGSGSLACVRRGDFLRFVEPTLGRMSCAITEVNRVLPKPQPVKDQIN